MPTCFCIDTQSTHVMRHNLCPYMTPSHQKIIHIYVTSKVAIEEVKVSWNVFDDMHKIPKLEIRVNKDIEFVW